jgi:SPP1 gp7 family putative phage head morphogenesis protein
VSQGKLQQTIAHYRQQLKQHEATAERTLEAAYASTLDTINPVLDILYRAMEAKIKLGEEIPLEYLYENQRLKTIKQLVEQQINHFGAMSQMQVGQMQQQGVQLGQQAAQALLQASVPPGINYSFGVPSAKAIADIVGATQAGPLADLFNGFGTEAAQGVSRVLITGVTLGYNPRQVAPMVQDALNVSRYRALTISRDQMLRAYRGSQLENYRANSDVVSQWRWTCDKSARTCAACLAMDGTLHDLDEELDEHCNGRCAPVPVTKSWDDILGPLGIDTAGIPDSNPIGDMQSGSDWFDAQTEKVQRQILGNSKYEAWSNGDFQLSDIVGHSSDPQWGESIYEKPLKALVR